MQLQCVSYTRGHPYTLIPIYKRLVGSRIGGVKDNRGFGQQGCFWGLRALVNNNGVTSIKILSSFVITSIIAITYDLHFYLDTTYRYGIIVLVIRHQRAIGANAQTYNKKINWTYTHRIKRGGK